jgi:hypothetical protein
MSDVDIANQALMSVGEAPRVSDLSPPTGGAHAELCAELFTSARECVLQMHAWNFAANRVPLTHVRLAISSVSAAGNTITTAVAHELDTDDVVRVVLSAGATIPAPLEEDTDYYAIEVSSTVVSLATEAEGDAIDLTSAGSGTLLLEKRTDRADWLYAYAVPSDCLIAHAVVPNDSGDEGTGLSLSGLSNSYQPSGWTVYPSASPHVRPIPYVRAINKAGDAVIYTNLDDADLRYTASVTDTDQWSPLAKQVLVRQLAVFLAGALKKDERTVRLAEQSLMAWLSKAATTDASERAGDVDFGYPWAR